MKLKSDKGMTLLELLVAMVILSVGAVGVLRAFGSSVSTSKAAERYSVAATLAHQTASKLERRAGGAPGPFSGAFGPGAEGFAWEAQVEPSASAGLMPMRVVVFWQDANHRRRFELLTCVRPEEQGQPTETPEARRPRNEKRQGRKSRVHAHRGHRCDNRPYDRDRIDIRRIPRREHDSVSN